MNLLDRATLAAALRDLADRIESGKANIIRAEVDQRPKTMTNQGNAETGYEQWYVDVWSTYR